MPERAESFVSAETLDKEIRNLQILNFSFIEKKNYKAIEDVELGSLITRVFSMGKKVIFELTSKEDKSCEYLIFGLGMSGCIALEGHQNKHKKITINLGIRTKKFDIVEKTIYFCDVRGIGSMVELHNTLEPLRKKLGYDILLDKFTSEQWIENLKRKKNLNKTIYHALKDQNNVAGIGNYLVAEILYAAKVNPSTLIRDLSDKTLVAIMNVSRAIVCEAVSYKGLTISDFWSPNGVRGIYPVKVYSRTKDPSGYKIAIEKLKGETQNVYWCPEVQKIES